MSGKVFLLALCHLRRFARKRQWLLPAVVVTLLLAGLQSRGKASLLVSTLALLAVSLAGFVLQTARDRDLGFAAGLLSTGMPRTGIYLSRALAAAVLFVMLCVLRSVVFSVL